MEAWEGWAHWFSWGRCELLSLEVVMVGAQRLLTVAEQRDSTLVTLSRPPRSQLVCLLLLSDQELPEDEGQTLFLAVVSDPSMSGHSQPWDALVELNSKYVS